MNELKELINYLTELTKARYFDVLISIGIIIVSLVLGNLIAYFSVKIFNIKIRDKNAIKNNPFYSPIKIAIILIGVYISVYILRLPDSLFLLWQKIFRIIIICVITKHLAHFVDPKSGVLLRFRKHHTGRDQTIANFTGMFLKYIVYIFSGFFIITELGYDVSSLVTGLGLSSALIALAAQDTVKSLIAGYTIVADKPFVVGDWIEIGDHQGTVVDSTFRCTKIQTAYNTTITLPNSTITTSPVINWSRMNQRRYSFNLKLPLKTSSDTIQSLCSKIKFVIETDEEVIPENVRVNFDILDQSGINLYIILYTSILDYTEYLTFRTKINNKIIKVLESENVNLAYPSQDVYLKSDDINKLVNIKLDNKKTTT